MLKMVDRLEVIDRVLADAPKVHDGAASGVWQAERTCYEWMARTLPEPATTLETGLGVSTVLFAAWGCTHTCVVGSDVQIERLREYCAARSISLARTTLIHGRSENVLPGLDLGELDFVLIDGGHGYPTPILDWFYGCRTLRVGGAIIVDDMQLPSVRDYLGTYLDLDPSWEPIEKRRRWKAYRRMSADPPGGEWDSQRFLGNPDVPLITRVKVFAAKMMRHP